MMSCFAVYDIYYYFASFFSIFWLLNNANNCLDYSKYLTQLQ